MRYPPTHKHATRRRIVDAAAQAFRERGVAETGVDEVMPWLKAEVRAGDVVLVKASRGMKMEQVVDALQGMKRVSKKAS